MYGFEDLLAASIIGAGVGSLAVYLIAIRYIRELEQDLRDRRGKTNEFRRRP